MKKQILICASLMALGVAMMSVGAQAQDAGVQDQAPQPVWAPPTPPIGDPQNIPYAAGTIKVAVDATDLDHRIFKIHETVPVNKAGDFVMMVPKWLPGHHSPGSDLTKIAGVIFKVDGKVIPWTRDVVDVYAFHINLPEGTKEVTVDFDYLVATTSRVGAFRMTPDMLNLQWTFASMYPAGYYVSQIPVQASVTYPAGWQAGTALEVESSSGDTVTYKTTPYDVLIDSPIYAGRYFKRVDLDPNGPAPVHMDIVADKPEQLAITDDELAIHRNLIQQAYKLYGAHHYDHYDFLVSASDNLASNGLEHHRSSEDGVDPKYFTDWKTKWLGRDLFSHEYTHSWNGKFRRPWDLWTPNYQVPMRDSLMWVYEGQTQYWGIMLAARSGLYSKDQALQILASTAAAYDNLPGREWRPLQDTTNDPIIAQRSPQGWRSYQRSEDYYNEGLLIWLDADTLIREKTNGKKSLDDFAKAFFGIDNGAWGEVTYNFNDVVNTLNSVYPYDWASFLRTRLDRTGEGKPLGAPLDGLARGGYKLAYVETPTDFIKLIETARKMTTFTYSLGISVANSDGTISDVLWGSPAFNAGLAPGATLVAVNGKAYDPDGLKAAITAAKTSKDPISLLVKVGDDYKTISLDYHDGLRYPVLQAIDGAPKLLDNILAAKK
ncbi:MAG: M61 family metallopeptidase [Asticcacaulis sp.]|uniref:M61 family metallopeptidase n=1 Tax=Asticcacaulis sp. TaxID=1872648 RepID=UPI003F7B55A2